MHTIVINVDSFWSFIVADFKLNWLFFIHFWYIWVILFLLGTIDSVLPKWRG